MVLAMLRGIRARRDGFRRSPVVGFSSALVGLPLVLLLAAGIKVRCLLFGSPDPVTPVATRAG
jgi:hypothetical protein